MGSSQNSLYKRACHFFEHGEPGETPIFRSTEYPLDKPLPNKYNGVHSTLLEAFE